MRTRKDNDPRPLHRTAGEVRFIKDRGDDSTAWAWGQHPPAERQMQHNFKYKKKCAKDLAKVLRSTLIALGHAMRAYTVFAKIKSRDISPDGNLGGRGYIMEIKSMRRQFMNITEALSALSDTIYDEINEDHWQVAQQKVVKKLMEQSEEIMEDPEQWAEEQAEGEEPTERNMVAPRGRTASQRIADRYMRRVR